MSEINKTVFTTANLMILAAVGVSSWIALGMGEAAPDGCGTGCGEVLSSRYSRIAGVSTAWLGVAVWSGLLMSSGALAKGKRTWTGWLGLFFAAATVFGATWFVWLQVGVLRAACPLCNTAHMCAVTGVLLLLRSRWAVMRQQMRPSFAGTAAAAGLAGVVCMALAGHASSPRQSVASLQSGPEVQGTHLILHGGAASVDTAAYPSLGSGEFGAVFLADYTCTHCRQMLAALKGMAAADPAMPKVVLLPVWRHAEGRDIHTILQSLYLDAPAAYEKLVASLLDGSLKPQAATVGRAALDAAGSQQFAAALSKHGERVEKLLADAAAVYAANRAAPGGSEALPQIVNHDKLMTGLQTNRESLAAFIGTAFPRSVSPAAAPPAPQIAAAPASLAKRGSIRHYRPEQVPVSQRQGRPAGSRSTNGNP